VSRGPARRPRREAPGSPLGGLYQGDEDFARFHAPARSIPEIPRRHTSPTRPPLDELLADGSPASIAAAYRHGYTLGAIARQTGRHYTTISRRLKRFEAGEPGPRPREMRLLEGRSRRSRIAPSVRWLAVPRRGRLREVNVDMKTAESRFAKDQRWSVPAERKEVWSCFLCASGSRWSRSPRSSSRPSSAATLGACRPSGLPP